MKTVGVFNNAYPETLIDDLEKRRADLVAKYSDDVAPPGSVFTISEPKPAIGLLALAAPKRIVTHIVIRFWNLPRYTTFGSYGIVICKKGALGHEGAAANPRGFLCCFVTQGLQVPDRAVLCMPAFFAHAVTAADVIGRIGVFANHKPSTDAGAVAMCHWHWYFDALQVCCAPVVASSLN